MDIFQAVVLSVVEGISEFLPVSSTGHMIMASHFLGIAQTDFVKTFEIAIQLGAIAAVFSMYWRTFLLDWEVGLKVLAAFVPTAVIGFVLYKMIKQHLMGNITVVAWALLVGGIILIVFEYFYRPKPGLVTDLSKVSFKQAVIIGTCQALAVVPGVSRSAATIIAGLMLGIGRVTVVEFSFLLAVPTMLAATALDLLKTSADITMGEWGLLAIGFTGAWIVAYLTVKFLLHFVQRNNFIGFGIYRIVAALVLLWILYK